MQQHTQDQPSLRPHRRVAAFVLAAAAAAVAGLATACAATPPVADDDAVRDTVRSYYQARNDGDLDAMLALSCDDIYSATLRLQQSAPGERAATLEAMRAAPVTITTVDLSGRTRTEVRVQTTGTVTVAGKTETGTQVGLVKLYQDHPRVCRLDG
ncbi:hypothetical protein [Gordonia sp. NPDC127522]|uniref:Rv0361 family membrane protein n=1 Tax=Gordonia sp. NPDC127522 TaxID=3345390 RepID=UPI00363FD43D